MASERDEMEMWDHDVGDATALALARGSLLRRSARIVTGGADHKPIRHHDA